MPEKRLPDDLGRLSTKIVIPVNVPLTIHGHNLDNLVQQVHWQSMVGSQHVRFEEDKIGIREISLDLHDGDTQSM